jgi:hypothetical protein
METDKGSNHSVVFRKETQLPSQAAFYMVHVEEAQQR